MCENFEEKQEVWQKGNEVWKLWGKMRGVRKSDTSEKKWDMQKKWELWEKVKYKKKSENKLDVWGKSERSVGKS